MLSQKELRRVVLILEEWTANTEASIFVYTKMREIYPRPEHQCVCGKKVDTSYLRRYDLVLILHTSYETPVMCIMISLFTMLFFII